MQYALAIWLGIMPTAIFGVFIDQWEWWACVIPMSVLVCISEKKGNEEKESQ